TRVAHVGDVQQSRDHRHRFVQRDTVIHQPLGQLVERDDRDERPRLGAQEHTGPKAVPRDHATVSASPSACSQRRQMPAASPSVTTSGTYRQHLSHLTPGARTTSMASVPGSAGRGGTPATACAAAATTENGSSAGPPRTMTSLTMNSGASWSACA